LNDAQQATAARGEGGGIGAVDDLVLEDVVVALNGAQRTRLVEPPPAANFRLVGIDQHDGLGRHPLQHARRETGQITAGTRLDGAVGVEQDVFRPLDNALGGAPLHFLLGVGTEVAHFVAVGHQARLQAEVEHFGAERHNRVVKVLFDLFPCLDQNGGLARPRHACDDD